MKQLSLYFLVVGLIVFVGCHENLFQPDLTPPSSPQGLFTETGDQFIAVFWNSNPEIDVAGYHVYVSTTLHGTYQLLCSTMKTEFVDKGIENGKTYYYSVSAYDFNGNESQPSHDVVYDIPRPEGYDVMLRDYRTSPDFAGYDFSTYSVGSYDDKYTDVFFETYNGTTYLNVWDDSDIQDVGYTRSLYDIGDAPTAGWSPSKDVRVIVGHTYIVRTWDNHYAKVRITSFSSTKVIFDWAYQLQEGNTRLKSSSEIDRGVLTLGSGAKGR